MHLSNKKLNSRVSFDYKTPILNLQASTALGTSLLLEKPLYEDDDFWEYHLLCLTGYEFLRKWEVEKARQILIEILDKYDTDQVIDTIIQEELIDEFSNQEKREIEHENAKKKIWEKIKRLHREISLTIQKNNLSQTHIIFSR